MKTNGNSKSHSRALIRQGFTLVEMLLVVAILGILAGIVYQNYGNYVIKARLVATRTQIGAFKNALMAYQVDVGQYPTTHDGLQALTLRPANAKMWHGPYIEKIPKDPWKNDYIYVCPGRHNPDGFDIVSPGPDGIAGNDDDIATWNLYD